MFEFKRPEAIIGFFIGILFGAIFTAAYFLGEHRAPRPSERRNGPAALITNDTLAFTETVYH